MAKCLKCGCTDRRACKGGCTWAKVHGAEGICSACIRDAVAVRVITFADQGQDFITWHLDEKGIVIDAEPFQAWLWQGMVVVNPNVRVGGFVRYLHPGKDEESTIRYRVVDSCRVKAPAGKALAASSKESA